MFKQMFRDINSSIELGSQAFNNFNKIYLKQVGYKIVDQVMHHVNLINTQPFSLRKSLDEFETGHVYEVVYKDNSGRYLSREQIIESGMSMRNRNQVSDIVEQSDNSNNHILIHIVNKHTTLNGKSYTLTFFRDVTFGVLYE